MTCKHLTIRTKKGIKYYYCRLHKNEVSLKCNYNCNDKEYKAYKTLSKRSNKQNKKEKQRFSIICPDTSKCVVCGSNWLITTHEIFVISNRTNSMLYGLTIPLCLECHSKYQNNKSFNDKWHIVGQTAFEKYYPNLEFVKIFYKNYKK